MSDQPTPGAATYSLGALYDVVAAWFPAHRTARGFLNVVGLADDLGLAHETVYKWFRKNRLSVRAARALIDKAEGRGKIEALHKFVYGG